MERWDPQAERNATPRLDEPLLEEDGTEDDDEPNGGVVAALIAAGLGCAVFGLLTVLGAASKRFSDLLSFYTPGGSLTGKSTVASLVFLLAWPNLHLRMRDNDYDLSRSFLLVLLLVGLGVILTFPPVYQLVGFND